MTRVVHQTYKQKLYLVNLKKELKSVVIDEKKTVIEVVKEAVTRRFIVVESSEKIKCTGDYKSER